MLPPERTSTPGAVAEANPNATARACTDEVLEVYRGWLKGGVLDTPEVRGDGNAKLPNQYTLKGALSASTT
jgi:hypothetical protein